jgi:hypothetical protein
MSETILYQAPLSSLLVQVTSSPAESDSVSLRTLTLILLVALVIVLLVSRFRQNDIWSFRVAILSLLGIGVTLLFVQLPYVIASVLAFTVDFYRACERAFCVLVSAPRCLKRVFLRRIL